MSLMSFISLNCNRHGSRRLCIFTFLVSGAVRRLLYVLAGGISVEEIWSNLFSVDGYPIVFAALCISIFIFSGKAAKAVTAAVLAVLWLWWMLGILYPSFPSVSTRHRAPNFSSFTFAVVSFSKRTGPSCGRIIIGIIPQVVTSLLPSAVVVLVLLRWCSEEAVTVRVFQKNLPSVVFVSVGKREVGGTQDERFVPEGTGSGFVWDKRGHIVTNFHVIRSESKDGERNVFVKLSNRDSYAADVIGYDEEKDVAVLRVSQQAKNMRPVLVGRSANLSVGQKVYAIGNPFGLDYTLTTGVVSGLGRDLKSQRGTVINDGIQTDASINPGSSGGPLLDSSGKLIGVNAAFYSPNGTSSGVGFSIGIDTVRGIIEQIIKKGKATRPYIGIKFSSSPSQQQHGHGGVHVYYVDPNSPAQKAGILPNRIEKEQEKKGDVIISFNGKRVNNGSDLYNILDECKFGNEVKVKVLRAGETKELVIIMGKRQ